MTIRAYLSKMKGGAKSPPGVGFGEVLWALVGSAIAICVCEYISARFFEPRDLTLMVGSLGASAVLVYGAIRSPFAQPRNLVGGHVISGLVGSRVLSALQRNTLAGSGPCRLPRHRGDAGDKDGASSRRGDRAHRRYRRTEGARPWLSLSVRACRAGRVDPPGGRAPGKQPLSEPKLSRLLVLKDVYRCTMFSR